MELRFSKPPKGMEELNGWVIVIDHNLENFVSCLRMRFTTSELEEFQRLLERRLRERFR